MIVTPERQALIDFSEPLFAGGDGLIVLKSDTKDYKSVEDLKGGLIGTQLGSPFVALIQKTGLFPDLKTYISVPEAMQSVSDGLNQGRHRWRPDCGLRATPGPFSKSSYRKILSVFDHFAGRDWRTQDGRRASEENQYFPGQTKGQRDDEFHLRQIWHRMEISRLTFSFPKSVLGHSLPRPLTTAMSDLHPTDGVIGLRLVDS